jgi:hypothetical protein
MGNMGNMGRMDIEDTGAKMDNTVEDKRDTVDRVPIDADNLHDHGGRCA